MKALTELQGKEAIQNIAPLLHDEVDEVRNVTKERLSQIQNPLLTALINKGITVLIVLCPVLAFMPFFLNGKKFYLGIATFIASLFLFRKIANIAPEIQYLREGTLGGEIYQAGVSFIFAGTMFVKLSWYLIKNLFKQPSDIDENNINRELKRNVSRE